MVVCGFVGRVVGFRLFWLLYVLCVACIGFGGCLYSFAVLLFGVGLSLWAYLICLVGLSWLVFWIECGWYWFSMLFFVFDVVNMWGFDGLVYSFGCLLSFRVGCYVVCLVCFALCFVLL